MEQDQQRAQAWLEACRIETEDAKHRTLPILAQWGLAELLHLLYEVLTEYVTGDRPLEALNLLVRLPRYPATCSVLASPRVTSCRSTGHCSR